METDFNNDPFEYEISTSSDGSKLATNPILSLCVMDDGDNKIFKRRSIKLNVANGKAIDSVLIGELEGVRVYIKDSNIILTKQDLYL